MPCPDERFMPDRLDLFIKPGIFKVSKFDCVKYEIIICTCRPICIHCRKFADLFFGVDNRDPYRPPVGKIT
jgi:hypothetical protein